MAGTIYNVAGAGVTAANGDYVESTEYFISGYPIYLHPGVGGNGSMGFYIAINTYSQKCALVGFASGTGGEPVYDGGNMSYQQKYVLNSGIDPAVGAWEAGLGFSPAPTVTLKSGSVEPASAMVLGSFL